MAQQFFILKKKLALIQPNLFYHPYSGPSSNKKRRKLSNASQYDGSGSSSGDFSGLLTGSLVDGYRFIEKFNRDMMDQFLDYQRRVVASQIRWEQERDHKYLATKEPLFSFFLEVLYNRENCNV